MLSILCASMLGFAAEADAPKGVAPEVVIVKAVKDQLTVTRTVYQSVAEKVKKQVTVDGKVQNVEVTQARVVPVQVSQTWPLTAETVTDAEGKKIPVANARKRLASETPVLLATSGQPIDKAYLKLFKGSVLIITLRPPTVAPVLSK